MIAHVDDKAIIEEQIEYYRRRAPEYDETSFPPGDPLAPYGHQLEKALERFRPSGRVLEIASGTGAWTAYLLRHAATVTALDSSAEMHDLSRTRLGNDPRVQYIQANVFSWEPDATYDVVFFANWLSHVPPSSFDRFWRIVRDALAPRGRVFLVDEAEDPWRNEELLREDFPEGPSVPVVRRSLGASGTFRIVKVFWRPKELQSRLRELGWDVAIHVTGPFYWGEARPTR